MATIDELLIVAAEQTLADIQRIQPERLRRATADKLGEEFRRLAAGRSSSDTDSMFIALDQIRRLSMDEVIGRDQKTDETWEYLIELAQHTTGHVQGLILHPDYKPPRGYPR